MFDGQYRKQWEKASLEFNGGVTYADRTGGLVGSNQFEDDELRGHVLAEALWDINTEWRAGSDLQWTSDDQYMREYDFVEDDVLTSELYAERLAGRDYLTGRLIKFQDIRVREFQEDQPEVLPEIVASFIGDPDSVPLIGGRWSVDSSYLGLRREGEDGQDYDRISFGGGWARHFVSDIGLLADLETSARHDVYHVRDRDDLLLGEDGTSSRFFPQAQFMTSYPLVRDFETVQVKLEPVVSVTAAPNVDFNDAIPNEDSQDVQLDVHNLFSSNRFPGIDRVEDQSRFTYGMRSGLYHGTLGEVRTFLGQSYRFDKDENPFPEESGLSDRSSDVVGEIAALYGSDYSLNYRFQMDSRYLTSRRHEIDAAADFGSLSLNGRYLFAKELSESGFDESREQVSLDTGYYWDENWQSLVGLTQDLGIDPGLRQAYLGLNYFGQCLYVSLIGQRNLTDGASGESESEVLFRVGLKSLGEFEESKFYDN